MPWLIGIDEAGYGPNLGPLVMTSVSCRVPDELVGADLWQVLQVAVRRHPSPDDGRLLVEDSKLVYSTARGLLDLEAGVLPILWPCRAGAGHCLAQLIDWLGPASGADLANEPWYCGNSPVPVLAKLADYAGLIARLDHVCRDRLVVWGAVRSVVVCPARFNQLLDQWGTKGACLGYGLAELLQCNRGLDGREPLCFFIDKHGGRNTYAAMLQQAIPEGLVTAQEESRNRSTYTVLGLDRDVRLTFQPRADASHFCVAWASMVSKYLRELLMLEFNRFWQARVPGLKPTAGYPGDAARFFEAILPAAKQLRIAEGTLWRRK